MATQLKDTSGNPVIADQGESAEITVAFVDADAGSLAKASISTLIVTQTLGNTSTVINSRIAQSVLDANDGTVATNGTLTFKIQPEDTVALKAAIGDQEQHWLTFTWTWTDGDGDPMTGSAAYYYLVRAKDATALTASSVGWVQ